MKPKIFTIAAMLLLVAGSFYTCQKNENNNELPDVTRSEGQDGVYVWPEGPKYYYAFDEKIFLYEAPNKVVLHFDEEYLFGIQRYLQGNDIIQHVKLLEHNCIFILTTTENANIKALMADLKKLAGMKSVNPMYLIYGGTEAGVTDEIVVQFKEHVTQQEIDSIHQKYRLVIKKFHPRSQLLSVPINLDPLEVANAIQESGLANYSHPNFILQVTFP